MKKLLMKSLLATALAFSGSNVFADSCSPCDSSSSSCNTSCGNVNKTFLMPRSHGVNLALGVTGGMYGFKRETKNLKYNGHLQSTWFYEASTDDDKIGRYFSPSRNGSGSGCSTACGSSSSSSDCNVECKSCPTGNTFSFGARTGADQTLVEDVNLRNFIHFPLGATVVDTKAATMNLTMNRKAYGNVLNYYQDLKKMVKGLFLKVNVPVVHVEHNIYACLQGFDVSQTVGSVTSVVWTAANIRDALEDYLSGNDVVLTIDEEEQPVLQERLQYDLIPPCDRSCDATPYCAGERLSRTGVADIDVMLGYKLLKEEKYRAAVSFGFTIPTGNKAHELRLWEPIVGNGGHWAVGAGLYGDMEAYNKDGHNLAFLTVLNYRYLLKNDECRKLGLCGQEWGHFRLLGKNGQNKLVPAANVLVQNVDVTPGSQVDWVVHLNYNKEGGFGFDCGYELYYRDREDVEKPCDILPVDTYAFPAKTFVNTDGQLFTSSAIELDANSEQNWLSDSDIDASVAETPAQLSHKIFAGLSWRFTEWTVPGVIGAGAHYEFGNGNQTLSTWGLNVKMAIAF